MPATYNGTVYWSSHSRPGTDDDYNIDMYRADNAGLTTTAERSSTLGNAAVMHMEFDSDETIDHFHTSWWSKFHHSVDNGDDSARSMIDGKDAIAIGLVGLDYAHSGNSELHPLYALAIHVQDDATDDQWAIFVRNRGDEGYCSSGIENFITTQVTFMIPRRGASAVQETNSEFLFGPDGMSAADKAQVTGPNISLNVAEGAFVTFTLPGPNSGARINGLLHLSWIVTGPRRTTFSALDAAATSRLQSGRTAKTGSSPVKADEEPEEMLGKRLDQLTPAQQAIYARLAPVRPFALDSGVLMARPGFKPSVASKAAIVLNVQDTEREVLERQKAQAFAQAIKPK